MTIDIHGPCMIALKALEALKTRRIGAMRKPDVTGGLRHVD
jgi:hypothetical protein